jgi:Helix-hairpin-helix motif
MVPKNFILALCCSIGAALPLTVVAQMSSPAPSGTSVPSEMTPSPAPSGGLMPSPMPSGEMTPSPTPSSGMPPASGGGMTPTTPGGMTAPDSGGTSSPSPTMSSPAKPKPPKTSKVSVNTATLNQLVKVKGIGPATANKIISGRPYANLDELVTKKVLTQKQLTQLKSQIGL